MDSENNLPTKLRTALPAITAPKSSPADKVRKVVALTKLRSHFYQPGQTEAQIRGVIDDMLADLDGLSAYQVEDACANYRRDGSNKFFPTPGQIIGAVGGKFPEPPRRLQEYDRKEFAGPRINATRTVAEVLRQAGEGRAAEDWEIWKDARPQQ